MKAMLRFFALFFLLPGLAGLAANATLSTHYFDTRPRLPDTDDIHTVGRLLNGQEIYLTFAENRQLDFLWTNGLRAFWIGMGLGVVYLGVMANHLERWQDSGDEEEDDEDDSHSPEYN